MATEVGTDVAEVLARVVERLDRLEAKMDALGASGPVATKLADPVVAERLAHLLDRLDQVERSFELLGNVGDRLPQVADAAATTLQMVWDEAVAKGIDPIELIQTSSPLAFRLAHPEAMALVNRLVDRMDDVTFALDKIDRLDEKLKEAGVDRGALADRSIDMAAKLAAVTLARNAEMTALIEKGPLEPDALDTVGKATSALVDVRRGPIEPMGMWGVFRALGDGDIQRAVGFTFAFLRRFGQLLR